MRTIVKHTLAWVLAGFFLVSFTGVRLLIHHCLACETSALYVLAELNHCCDHSGSTHEMGCSIHDENQGSCCSSEDPDNHCENCCQDEVVYVKNDYEVSKDRQLNRIEPVVVSSVDFVTASPVALTLDENELHFFSSNVDPPPKRVAKDFVLFAHQLKIC